MSRPTDYLSEDDAYDPGDPKRSDYSASETCSLCLGTFGRHYESCPNG